LLAGGLFWGVVLVGVGGGGCLVVLLWWGGGWVFLFYWGVFFFFWWGCLYSVLFCVVLGVWLFVGVIFFLWVCFGCLGGVCFWFGGWGGGGAGWGGGGRARPARS
ncbi:hypothetical protein PUR56_33615, partial [Streptomyces sp. BE303]|nr:hypothetical protein [Streptomyces sp. BE303]